MQRALPAQNLGGIGIGEGSPGAATHLRRHTSRTYRRFIKELKSVTATLLNDPNDTVAQEAFKRLEQEHPTSTLIPAAKRKLKGERRGKKKS